jgi:hypothetical protein
VKTLEQYLDDWWRGGSTGHSFLVDVRPNGETVIYIRPDGKACERIAFVVKDNRLELYSP